MLDQPETTICQRHIQPIEQRTAFLLHYSAASYASSMYMYEVHTVCPVALQYIHMHSSASMQLSHTGN